MTFQKISRRQLLSAVALAPAGMASASLQASAQTAPAPGPGRVGEGQRFDFAALVDIAAALAKRPYVAPVINDLPDGYANMPYDAYVGIRAQAGAMLWAGENRGITIEPLHRGYVFTAPTPLFTIEDGVVRRVVYDRSKFDFGKVAPPAAGVDLAFSGFRISAGLERMQEVALFQGPALFRCLAKGQNYGIIARGLILRPGENKGEEIPQVRGYWIERPSAQSGVLVIHALIDSESMAGAARLTLRPGDLTFVDVEHTFFARTAIDHYGIGGAMGSFLFSPWNRRQPDDVRPAVYEISGLQMLSGAGEWIYRPLNNPTTLQASAFVDENPKGFGLVMRDRDFAAFQDDDQRFETRPSLWIEPLGEWGAGSVQLLEIPSDSEINDNIVAYWRPKRALAPGDSASFAYRQAWCWFPPERPSLATVTRLRQGRGTQGRRRRFVLDFNGDQLADAQILSGLHPIVSASPGSVQNIRMVSYPERKSVRVSFELDPGNEAMSELRLVLEAGGKPASETWLNRWTP